ncbi:hypothetical protein CDCA_CDCA13G3708 [Cyanidium caldarium]|uniref:FCS-type domain-containing protein n=1 Tax=Cyanidium caldarium TaxID=2771 RepID=A0AAV9J018_CYACA|nr:hypothetical protein CDCA_CDCA13G3708 [Cyanidium caldarium]
MSSSAASAAAVAATHEAVGTSSTAHRRRSRLPPLRPASRACPVCHVRHTGLYGAGRYCSRSCSHRASALMKWGKLQATALLQREQWRAGRQRGRPPAKEKVTAANEVVCKRKRRGRPAGAVRRSRARRSSAPPTPPDHLFADSNGLVGEPLQIYRHGTGTWVLVQAVEYDPVHDRHRVCSLTKGVQPPSHPSTRWSTWLDLRCVPVRFADDACCGDAAAPRCVC